MDDKNLVAKWTEHAGAPGDDQVRVFAPSSEAILTSKVCVGTDGSLVLVSG
jgi:hypothetical protein